MTEPARSRGASLALGMLFSLAYVSLYPILIGGSVIYRYPSWTATGAVAYVLGGILLQALRQRIVCFAKRIVTNTQSHASAPVA